jgi:hypothetical protein
MIGYLVLAALLVWLATALRWFAMEIPHRSATFTPKRIIWSSITWLPWWLYYNLFTRWRS